MDIPLNKLNYTFINKPLLVGGMAMQYYGLRESGKDIDFIASEADVVNLIKQYPNRIKDLWGDLGVCPFEFEIWKSICLFSYDDLTPNAIDENQFLVISLDKLLLMKVLGMKVEKYLRDTELIAQNILDKQYQSYDKVRSKNISLLAGIRGLNYIERTGPSGEAKQ